MHSFHPLLVHFPTALVSASVFSDLLARRWRRNEAQAASLYTLALGPAGAAASVISGHLAEEVVEHGGVPKHVLEIHERLGFAAVRLLADLLTLHGAERPGFVVERPALRIALGLEAVAVPFAAGDFGGSLVDEFGAGAAVLR